MRLAFLFSRTRWMPMLLVFAVGLLPGQGWAATDDGTQFTQPPPAIYEQNIAKLLTPVEEILKKESEYAHLQGDNDGIVLLEEVVHYVDEDGHHYAVYHYVDKALNDAGVRGLAQSSFSFRKKIQHLYLITAQTIQPDGTRDPVKSDAIFLKSPQDQLGESIYNDEQSMLTVFSNVKPGSITERIILMEELEPRIPGQYTQVYTWVDSWPMYSQRLLVDLPKTYADRLKIHSLGSGVPTPSKLNPTPQRQRWTWEKLNTDAESDDSSGAPSLQTGPLVSLSTLPDWDTFAAWYNGLIKGTDQLNPELKAKVADWTKDAKDPAEVLRILYEHVARDIRYTGFELGQADYKPHDAVSVWDRQYGDCKDKANLLRALLAYKGIPSWLTLLSTEHAGVIDRESVDYRMFDHCILDVQLGQENIICDPTITYGSPGLLGGFEANRDLLVIKDDKAEWLHAPTMKEAELSYTFDLQLRPSGELAGWADDDATGYYYAHHQNYFKDLTKEQIRNSLQDSIRNIFPNANVVDVAPTPMGAPLGDAPAAGNTKFTMRAYMVLPGVLNQGATSAQLNFPDPAAYLPNLENYQKRKHNTFLWPDVNRISVKIQLPTGWTAPMLPAPMAYNSAAADIQASWTANQDTLSANFTITTKQSSFSPEEMLTLGNAITNLKVWASKSIILAKSDTSTTAPGAPLTDVDLALNLPVMPTGEGQLKLIDSEFPDDGNRAARRAAYARIAILFPTDKKSIVDANLHLASMDLDDEKWSDALTRVSTTVEANRPVLDIETLAWADYLSARALLGQKKNAEALGAFQKIANDGQISSFRRAWAFYHAAKILVDKSPAEALNYADPGLDLDSTALPYLYGFYASTAIANNGTDRLKARLVKLIATKPDNLEAILLQISDTAHDLILGGQTQDGLNLVSLLESISSPMTTGDAVARALKQVRDGAQSLGIYAKIQQNLKDALAQYPDIAALEQKQPAFASVTDATNSASQHEDKSEAGEALGASLRAAIGYPVGDTFPQRFWKCFQCAEWVMRATPAPTKDAFFYKLAEIGGQLPHGDDAYVDVQLLLGKVYEKNNRRPESTGLYENLLKQTDLADGFLGAINLRNGNNWAEQGDYTKALAAYHAAEPFVELATNAQEAVLRAAFIQLDNGDKTEAFRLLKLLAQAVQKGKIKAGEQVQDFIATGEGSSDVPVFWDSWQSWWPQWQQMETAAGLVPDKDKKVVPYIPSLYDLGKELGSLKDPKNPQPFFNLLRQAAYAARYYPRAAVEFADILTVAEDVLPDKANDLRLLGITILKPLVLVDSEQQRQRILRLLVDYVDSSQNDKALALMKAEWTTALDNGDDFARAIHRVWAIAAVAQHQDLELLRDTLVKDLADPAGSNRRLSIGMLADVYSALGQPENADHLLTAELTNPVITANPDDVEKLKSRLENLRNVALATKQLADGVAQWLAAHKPAWWDYAEPKTTADPRMARLDEIINNPNGEFRIPERVKAGLLAPSVASLNTDTQQQAVLQSFNDLGDVIATQDEADGFAKSILDNALLPSSLKEDFLYHFLLHDGSLGQAASFQAFRQSSVISTYSSTAKDVVERLDTYLKLNRTSSAAVVAHVQNIAKRTMDWFDIAMVQDCVFYLLQLGDIDGATAIYQSAANFTLADTTHTTKPQLQLGLLRSINAVKHVEPILQAFRTEVLAAHPADSIPQPANFALRRDREHFDDLSEADATALRLYLIKIHQEPPNLNFWFDFMADLPHDAPSAQLILKFLQVGLSQTTDDDVVSQIAGRGTGLLDIDNPDLRQKFLALTQPYRDPAKYPQTNENLRMFDHMLALRLGQPVNLETDLNGYTSSQNIYEALFLRLRAYRQKGDLIKLKDMLNKLPADQLVGTRLINSTLPDLVAVGLTDEAALARDTLKKNLYQTVLDAWYYGDGGSIHSITSEVLALDTAEDVPESFTTFADSHFTRRQQLAAFQIYRAYLSKDWPAVEAKSTAYTHDYPTYYSFYWYLGRSLAEEGKNNEAIKALTTYCQYSHDEVEFPEAQALLDKLSAKR